MIKKILIVEDESISAKYLRKLIELEGYTVVDSVKSGEKAIEVVQNEDVDLILMDVFLDGKLDGIETAKIIQAQKNVKIIFTSANSDEPIFSSVKENNVIGFIKKPISDKKLFKLIENI